jgi:hypothetical protein
MKLLPGKIAVRGESSFSVILLKCDNKCVYLYEL